jgi:Tfp pilus assembly protein PilE
VAFIGLLAAIAIPSFMKARETSQRKTCLRNLRLIEETKAEWAVQHNATNNVAIPEEEFEKLLAKKHPQPLVCPQDPEKSFSTSYDINLTGVAPACRCDESHVLGYYEYSEEETTGPPEDGD